VIRNSGEMIIEILYEDIVVAYWQNNHLHICDRTHLPLFLKRKSDLYAWLTTRMADISRPNIRHLYEYFSIKDDNPCTVLLPFHAVTVTDHYWIRQKGDLSTWAEISRLTDTLGEAALMGKYPNEKLYNTPEMTNLGSFEKCWKKSPQGSWVLYKRATENEKFSELFAEKLGQSLGLHMAEYFTEGFCICSNDFTIGGSFTLEHAAAFVDEDDEEEDILSKIDQICPQAAKDYTDMIYLDALIANPDRHIYNWGLLRNSDGDILGLAPCFDHNLALISRNEEILNKRASDRLIKDYKNLIQNHPNLYREYPFALDDRVKEICSNLLVTLDFSRKLSEFLTARARLLNI